MTRDKGKFRWNPGDIQVTRRGPGKPAPAAEVKDLADAIASVTGREDTVRRHLAVAGVSIDGGDVKTAYGALDLARRYALGEFGDNPDRAVLLGDKTEAWRPILRLRDSLRAASGER